MGLNNVGGIGVDILAGRNTGSPALRDFREEFKKTEKAVGRGSAGVERATMDVDQALGQMAAGAATAGIGIGIMAAPFALASRAAGPFQEALAQLAAISGATSEQMARMKDAAIDAGIATQFDPTQAAAAMADLAAAGFDVEESLSLMRPTLDLAAGSLGQLSPSDAAGLASQAMKAFGVDTADAGMAVDQMLQSVNVFALGARDLPLALGTAARGAGTLNQSLDETLVALGLVKNVVPGVERASTAVSTAMEKMVDADTKQALKGIGVSVADASGKFRPFLDIVTDMLPALDKMSDEKRGEFLKKTFGAEALAGFGAISTQLNTGLKDTNGNLLKGADAVAYLRAQFKNAGGTAEKFASKLLDTLPGQLKLLKGSLSTLGIVVGEEFAFVFRPMVEKVLAGLNAVLAFVRGMPPEMKRAIAGIAVTFTTVIGGLITIGGLLKTFGPALQFVQAAFAGVGLKAALVIGAIVLAFTALKAAYDANLGGIADSFNAAFAKVKLAYDILVQLFTKGGVSGAVREEFFKAENEGVRAFAVQIYEWFTRIKAFASEFATGFGEAVRRAEPSFTMLFNAIRRLGQAFGFIAETPEEAGQAFNKMGERGLELGRMVGRGLGLIADYLTVVIDYWTGFKKELKLGEVWTTLVSSFKLVGEAISSVTTALGGLSSSFGGSGSAASVFGQILGVSVMATIRTVANVVQWLATLVANAGQVLGGSLNLVIGLLTGNWARAWLGAKQIVFGVVSSIVDTFGALIQFVASGLDQLSRLGGNKTSYAADVAAWRTNFRDDMAAGLGVDAAGVEQATAPPVVQTANPLSIPAAGLPAAMVASGVGANASQDTELMSKGVGDAVATAIAKAPTQVNVYVGDEQIMSVIESKSAESAARNFTPQSPEA